MKLQVYKVPPLTQHINGCCEKGAFVIYDLFVESTTLMIINI